MRTDKIKKSLSCKCHIDAFRMKVSPTLLSRGSKIVFFLFLQHEPSNALEHKQYIPLIICSSVCTQMRSASLKCRKEKHPSKIQSDDCTPHKRCNDTSELNWSLQRSMRGVVARLDATVLRRRNLDDACGQFVEDF